MAFGTFTWWEVQTGGSDTANGGGFDNQNANMLTDLAATFATSNAPVVTSASYSFVSADVGHWLYEQKGTGNWLSGWYQIVSVSGGAATLNAGIAAGVTYYTQSAGKAINSPIMSKAAGIATTASPTGGTWAIDYSQTASARLTYTDLVIGTTTTNLTSAANPFNKAMVGNIIAVTSGTGFTVQRVQINSVTGTTATMDKACGTASSTSGVGGLGGALASPGMASGLLVSTGNNGIWIKTGTYTMSVNTDNVSGGRIKPSATIAGTVENFMFIFGYNAVRGDNPLGSSRPNIVAGSAISGPTAMLGLATEGMKVGYLSLDAQNKTSINVISTSAIGNEVFNCKVQNATLSGFNVSSGNALFVGCEYTGGTTGSSSGGFTALAASFFLGCVAHDFAGIGFNIANATCVDCLAYNCTGAASDGFLAANQWIFLSNCTANNCGRDGIRGNANGSRIPVAFVNCLSTNNAGKGFGNATLSDPLEVLLYNCATYNNTGGAIDLGYNNVQNLITLTADPYTAVGTNFGLNSAAGGGALLRAAGYPSTIPGPTAGINYRDVGAYQHQDSGGGGQYAMAWVG